MSAGTRESELTGQTRAVLVPCTPSREDRAAFAAVSPPVSPDTAARREVRGMRGRTGHRTHTRIHEFMCVYGMVCSSTRPGPRLRGVKYIPCRWRAALLTAVCVVVSYYNCVGCWPRYTSTAEAHSRLSKAVSRGSRGAHRPGGRRPGPPGGAGRPRHASRGVARESSRRTVRPHDGPRRAARDDGTDETECGRERSLICEKTETVKCEQLSVNL